MMTNPANKFNNAIKDTIDSFRAMMPGIVPRPLRMLKERQTKSEPQRVIVVNEAGEVVGETKMTSPAEIRSETEHLQLDEFGAPRPKTKSLVKEWKPMAFISSIRERIKDRLGKWRSPAPEEPLPEEPLPEKPGTPPLPDTGQPPTPKEQFDTNAVRSYGPWAKTIRVSKDKEIALSM